MSIFKTIIGERRNFSLEEIYVIAISFYGFLAMFTGIFVYLLSPSTVYPLARITGILSLGYLFIYFRARLLNKFDWAIELCSLFLLMFFNYAWFLSGGIYSPNLLIPIIIIVFVSILSRGISRLLMITTVILNVIIVITLEYVNPSIVIPYTSRSALFFDNITTYLLSFSVIWTAMSHMMNCYSIEKKVLFQTNINLKKKKEELAKINKELEEALAQVKQLSGFIPICPRCKKVKDDKGYWNEVEIYIHNHSDAMFSHGLCPDCLKQLYPEYFNEEKTSDKTVDQ